MTLLCAKFGQNRIIRNETAAVKVKFNMAAAVILEFRKTSGFAYVRQEMLPWVWHLNFITIGQYLAKLQHFFRKSKMAAAGILVCL